MSERLSAIRHVREALSRWESAVEVMRLGFPSQPSVCCQRWAQAAVKLNLPPLLDSLLHEDNEELKLEGAW